MSSRSRWYNYSRARDAMLKATDSKHAPWYIVRTDDKRRGRLNCISHILERHSLQENSRPKGQAPARSNKGAYDDHTTLKGRRFVTEVY